MKNLIKTKDIEDTKTLITEMESLTRNLKVNSQSTLSKANDYLVELTRREKKVIERERQILDPLNVARNSILDFFRPVKERFVEIRRLLKKEIGYYITKLEDAEIQKKLEIKEKVISGKIDTDKALDMVQKNRKEERCCYNQRRKNCRNY